MTSPPRESEPAGTVMPKDDKRIPTQQVKAELRHEDRSNHHIIGNLKSTATKSSRGIKKKKKLHSPKTTKLYKTFANTLVVEHVHDYLYTSVYVLFYANLCPV